MKTATVHVPWDMREEMVIVADLDTTEMIPLYVADNSKFTLAIYGDYTGISAKEENHRATMVAQTTARDTACTPDSCYCDNEPFFGDVFIVGTEDLMQSLVRYDGESRDREKAVRGFHAWLKDFSASNAMDIVAVVDAVAEYIADVNRRSMENIGLDGVIANLFGIDPRQVKVFTL